MNLFKTATSSALAAAISLSVGCASTPNTTEVIDEPSQEESAQAQAPEQESSEVEVEVELSTAVAAEPVASSIAAQPQPEVAVVKPDVDAAKTAQQPVKLKQEETKQVKQLKASQDIKASQDKKAKAQVAQAQKAKAETVPQASAKASAAQTKISKKLLKNALNVKNKDLPVTVELWTLREGFEPNEGLVLSTPTMQMGDGDYLSQIRLTLKENQLVINSSSDIDSSLSGVGIRYNGSALIPFDRLDGSNVGILEGDWMRKFAEGGNLEIALGFFPDKTQDSPLFKKEASINALSKLVPTYYKLQ